MIVYKPKPRHANFAITIVFKNQKIMEDFCFWLIDNENKDLQILPSISEFGCNSSGQSVMQSLDWPLNPTDIENIFESFREKVNDDDFSAEWIFIKNYRCSEPPSILQDFAGDLDVSESTIEHEYLAFLKKLPYKSYFHFWMSYSAAGRKNETN